MRGLMGTGGVHEFRENCGPSPTLSKHKFYMDYGFESYYIRYSYPAVRTKQQNIHGARSQKTLGAFKGEFASMIVP